jgi:hypothetical protein
MQAASGAGGCPVDQGASAEGRTQLMGAPDIPASRAGGGQRAGVNSPPPGPPPRAPASPGSSTSSGVHAPGFHRARTPRSARGDTDRVRERVRTVVILRICGLHIGGRRLADLAPRPVVCTGHGRPCPGTAATHGHPSTRSQRRRSTGWPLGAPPAGPPVARTGAVLSSGVPPAGARLGSPGPPLGGTADGAVGTTACTASQPGREPLGQVSLVGAATSTGAERTQLREHAP